MAKETKEELEAQLGVVRLKLYRITAAERAAENAPLVGKCFKYRNNYSIPEKPSDYWWLYVKVLKGDKDGCRTFEFQTDKYGKIDVRPNESHPYMRVGDGLYNEIPAREFNAAWRVVQRRIAGFKP